MRQRPAHGNTTPGGAPDVQHHFQVVLQLPVKRHSHRRANVSGAMGWSARTSTVGGSPAMENVALAPNGTVCFTAKLQTQRGAVTAANNPGLWIGQQLVFRKGQPLNVQGAGLMAKDFLALVPGLFSFG